MSHSFNNWNHKDLLNEELNWREIKEYGKIIIIQYLPPNSIEKFDEVEGQHLIPWFSTHFFFYVVQKIKDDKLCLLI